MVYKASMLDIDWGGPIYIYICSVVVCKASMLD